MGWEQTLFGGSGSTPSSYASQTQYQNSPQLWAGYTNGSAQAMGQVAPQLDPTQQAQFRNMQMTQANQLAGIASGQQQGAGELAAQRQVANAQAAQQAQASMARGGGNAALAMRNAASNQAGIGLSGAGQAQQAALSDQQAAQGQLSNVLNQGRGSDLSMAGQNANLSQQQMAQNNQANLGYLNGLGTMDANQLNAQMQAYGANMNNHGILGGLLSTAGQVGAAYAMPKPPAPAASDERLKTGVRNAGKDIDDMLDRLAAKSYSYKDQAKHGAGERAGIMAQDLERSKAGKALVVDLPQDPGYKGFDINKALSAALASSARLNERLRKLEGSR